jgi:hypothetical protein
MMTARDALCEAITTFAAKWPRSTISGDINMEDYYLLAQGVEANLPPRQLPMFLPTKRTAVKIVKEVGQRLLTSKIGGTFEFLRRIDPPSVMSARGFDLVDFIRNEGLLDSDEPGCFLASVYMYHAFLNMAKATRPTAMDSSKPREDKAEIKIADSERESHYDWLNAHRFAQRARGNLWVEFGMCLPRYTDLNQDRIIHE